MTMMKNFIFIIFISHLNIIESEPSDGDKLSFEIYKNDKVIHSLSKILHTVQRSFIEAPSLQAHLNRSNSYNWMEVMRYENKTKEQLIKELENNLLSIMSDVQAKIFKGEKVKNEQRISIQELASELRNLGVKDLLHDDSFLNRVLEKANLILKEIDQSKEIFKPDSNNTHPIQYSPAYFEGETSHSKSSFNTWVAILSINVQNLGKEILQTPVLEPNLEKFQKADEDITPRLINTNRLSLNRKCALVAFCRLQKLPICSKIASFESKCRSGRSINDEDGELITKIKLWRRKLIRSALDDAKDDIKDFVREIKQVYISYVSRMMSSTYLVAKYLIDSFSQKLKTIDRELLLKMIKSLISLYDL